ncbi:MAG: hypothetical protein PHU22_11980 [Eubacteriales bacterium]|nr:hypothetical protein [Eubacteriales bacterium]
MKRLIAAIITIAIILTLVPTGVFAASGNLGGGGGSLGNAVNNFYWNPGFCGARITVVTESGTQIGSSFDWLNSSCYGAATYHFGKHSKLYYRGITNINQMSERYGDYAATVNAEMPTIVLASGSNIDWIRSYFTGNSALTAIAARVGANYSDFDGCGYPSIWTTIGGVQTKLCVVIEPIVAVMCGGKPLTCTATELALYAQANAGVQNYLASIYRMQAPLAIYLQHPQLGFRSNPDLGIYWRSREDVISYLGIGIVSFGENGASFEPPVDPEDLPDPEVETPPTSYEYRTSTEVYTSVKVTNNTGADIKDGADIKFHIMGNGIDAEYTHKVLLPKEKSQLAYVKWTTPATVGVCNVAVEADDGIELSCDNVTCNIATYAITEPPDTKLETADPYWHSTAFSTSHSPYGGTTGALEWGHWEWSNIVGGGTINANVYDYNESGYTYYTAWQEAFKSVAEYAETVFQKVQSTKPAIYSSTEWRTKTAIAAEGETVPAPTETQIINIVGSGPVFRTREFLYCKYPIRKDYWYYSRAHRVEVLTPVYGTAWRTYYNTF